jgi:hypothetical protein
MEMATWKMRNVLHAESNAQMVNVIDVVYV